jgi:PhnB protein
MIRRVFTSRVKEAVVSVKAQPDGYHTVTPYLLIDGAAGALVFYREAFGAEELLRIGDDAQIGHAEIRIGDSVVMLADASGESFGRGPTALGATSVGLMIYVPDVDARFATALAAGATEVRPIVDQFYGDRSGTLRDPFGHIWTIATHIEDVSPEQIAERLAAMQG